MQTENMYGTKILRKPKLSGRSKQKYLKRSCIEFKYYADAINSDLTPPG